LSKFKRESEITYDIEIKMPYNSSGKFHFDIETRYIYLTSSIDLELYSVKDNKKIAFATWFN
jgi:hypothetical protein